MCAIIPALAPWTGKAYLWRPAAQKGEGRWGDGEREGPWADSPGKGWSQNPALKADINSSLMDLHGPLAGKDQRKLVLVP